MEVNSILMCSRRYNSRAAIEAYIRGKILADEGSSTLMIASPNDPIEKVPELLWYDYDASVIPKLEVIWHDRYKHPIKTCYEWAKESGYEM